MSSLADRLEIWGFEKDSVIFSDGSLGFGLEVVPIDVSCRSDGDINAVHGQIIQFLNGLPAGIDIQLIQDIEGGNGNLIESHSKLAAVGVNPISAAISKQRASSLERLDSEGLLPKHGLKIFVRRPSPVKLLSKPKLFSKHKQFEGMASQRLEIELSALAQLQKSIVSELKTLGLEGRSLTSDEVLDLVYSQWNPDRRLNRPPHNPEDVRSSLVFTDVGISDKGFSISDIHHRLISLKILPDETFASMAQVLRELPFDSRLFLSIHVPDQQREIESLQSQRRIAFSMARGKKNGVSDIDSESKFQDLESLLEKMISEGEKVFHVSLNILLRSSDLSSLEAETTNALTKLREMGGAEGMSETLAAFDIFSELAIPNARARQRAKRVKSSNLADLLPVYGPWPGHSRPSILLRSRMGSLISFDPFSPTLSNYNHIVSGGSGSGKSFLTNLLLLQMLKENPKIFIVDIGGSYKKLCDNLDGQYIPLGVDSGMSINPFDLNPGDISPSNHKIKFLVGLLELMTKEEGSKQLPRYERAEIELAIGKVYEQNNPTLSRLREILLSHPDSQIRRIGNILTSWCGDTPFGRLVDRKTTIELNRPIVSFDLKGMESYPDLQAATLFMITDFVWREVERDCKSKKFLIFDECWRFLENESGSAFIAEVFRTFRKYFAGTIAISQNLDDFAKSRVADAILSNSATKWILMQKGADQARLKEVLQLNDTEMELIASLHQERGEYSEVFLITEGNRSLVVVEPTPLEYWIATTDPRDLIEIDTVTKQKPEAGNLSILTELAATYPRGAAASKQKGKNANALK